MKKTFLIIAIFAGATMLFAQEAADAAAVDIKPDEAAADATAEEAAEEVPTETTFLTIKNVDDTLTICGIDGAIPDKVPLVIPDTIDGVTVTEIGNDAFFCCKYISVEFPATIRKVGKRAFSKCVYLKDVILPEECNIKWTKGAFKDCFSITKEATETLREAGYKGKF